MKPILHHGDCLEILPALEAESVDSIITDPPYGISFLEQNWDHGIPGTTFWKEALRVARPGAFLLAFGGTRTFHRLACAIEDAGWDIRDCIMWVYSSGFPKSLDVSKAMDKAAGAQRDVVGSAADFARDGSKRKTDKSHAKPHADQGGHGYKDRWSAPVTVPKTEEAQKWSGWGTALKPAWEPIIVARKPLEGTVIENIREHGTGAMNIGGCKVGTDVVSTHSRGSNSAFPKRTGEKTATESDRKKDQREGLDHSNRQGRWPANVIHDGSDEVMSAFDKAGNRPSCNSPSEAKCRSKYRPEQGKYQSQGPIYPGDTGSAARFFYCAKASRADRNEGLDDPGPQFKHGVTLRKIENTTTRGNSHPTVKPTRLMRYLCRLVTPPEGIILDPFMGSGSTGKAAMLEGFNFVGIEKEEKYVEIAKKRVREDPFS